MNDSIERRVDLAGAAEATLTFDYRLYDVAETAEFVLEVSTDDGSTWESTPLGVYNDEELVFGETVDLSPYATGDTRIRFRVTNSDEDAHLYIDNVRVDVADGDAYDPYGHGTHVAGIVAGDGNASSSALHRCSAWRERTLDPRS